MTDCCKECDYLDKEEQKLKEEQELFECRYCYKKKMKHKGQICEICHSVFGGYVIELKVSPSNKELENFILYEAYN